MKVLIYLKNIIDPSFWRVLCTYTPFRKYSHRTLYAFTWD